MATIAGRGEAQDWDLTSGEIHPIGATAENDAVRFPLVLGPYEAKVVVVGPLRGPLPILLRTGRRAHQRSGS